MAKDFLDEIIEERAARNPRMLDLVAEATTRRKLARRLAAKRESKALSQTFVAKKMRTTQSVVSKLEGGADVMLSTLQRYCRVIGIDLAKSFAAHPSVGTRTTKTTRKRVAHAPRTVAKR